MSWRCHAKPARLNGQVCGWENKTMVRHQELVVCAYCGCTKIASDLRRTAPEFDKPVKKSARPGVSGARGGPGA